MAEEVKLRMARAYPDQVQRMREWFQGLENIMHDETAENEDVSMWINQHYQEVANDWERILFGYDTLIENVCDQTKSYLEFKPEILAAFALAKKAEELRSLAQFIVNNKKNFVIGDRDGVASATIDKLAAILEVGEASKPSQSEK
jgi:hypothetical protein